MGVEMKAVILAGGLGTRLREETEFKPKPMVQIGDQPILWHIMKNLSSQGINEFVICLGYKGEVIKDYFMNYAERTHDITVSLREKNLVTINNPAIEEDWTVTLANTGALTMTGGRIERIRKYVEGETFLCTYGDGLSDVNVEELTNFHKAHGKISTVTAVRPTNRFGSLQINSNGNVTAFSEKPKSDKWVSGGYFIFEPQVFEYLDSECILEKGPLEKLATDGQLKAYEHHGFWQPMDTYRETQDLNELWDSGAAPWKNWK